MANEVVPEALRRRYVDSFAGKCVAFEAAIDGIGGDEGISTLRDLAHKLAGSAGMYGFDDLGHLARELVHAVDAGAGASIVSGLARDIVARLSVAKSLLIV